MMLFRQYLEEHRFLAVGYFFLLLINILAGTYYWPELRDNFPEVIKLIPLEPLQEFVRAFETNGYWAYFSVQQFFKGAGMFGIAAGGLIGSGLVAREVDRRTAELLLSRPVSRARILFTRWLAGAFLLFIPYIGVALIGWAVAPQVDENLEFLLVLRGSCYTFLFILCAYTATVALSTRFSNQLKAGILVLGLLLMQLAIYMIDKLWDYSLYNLIDLDVVLPMDGGPFPWLEAGWLSAFTLLFYGLALWGFRSRDF
jgi:ABC-type transport system involved in multi-copper enzyme maturation permease subunit